MRSWWGGLRFCSFVLLFAMSSSAWAGGQRRTLSDPARQTEATRQINHIAEAMNSGEGLAAWTYVVHAASEVSTLYYGFLKQLEEHPKGLERMYELLSDHQIAGEYGDQDDPARFYAEVHLIREYGHAEKDRLVISVHDRKLDTEFEFVPENWIEDRQIRLTRSHEERFGNLLTGFGDHNAYGRSGGVVIVPIPARSQAQQEELHQALIRSETWFHHSLTPLPKHFKLQIEDLAQQLDEPLLLKPKRWSSEWLYWMKKKILIPFEKGRAWYAMGVSVAAFAGAIGVGIWGTHTGMLIPGAGMEAAVTMGLLSAALTFPRQMIGAQVRKVLKSGPRQDLFGGKLRLGHFTNNFIDGLIMGLPMFYLTQNATDAMPFAVFVTSAAMVSRVLTSVTANQFYREQEKEFTNQLKEEGLAIRFVESKAKNPGDPGYWELRLDTILRGLWDNLKTTGNRVADVLAPDGWHWSSDRFFEPAMGSKVALTGGLVFWTLRQALKIVKKNKHCARLFDNDELKLDPTRVSDSGED